MIYNGKYMKLCPNPYLSVVATASDSETQPRVKVLEFGPWLDSRCQGQVTTRN